MIIKKTLGRMLGSSGLGETQLAISWEQNNETSPSIRVGLFCEDLVNSHEGLYPMQLVNMLV
jgi:hypothetical protein